MVVDVLSFSSAVATAVENGAIIFPCAWEDDPAALAARADAEAAVKRQDVPARGRFSLSPPTFDTARPDERIVLASPNGGTCSRYGRRVPHLFVGALVNAQAVAGALAAVLDESPNSVATVLACGERWQEPSEDGELRFALEDYVGVGAILAHLPPRLSRSPEARAAEAAFQDTRPDLAAVLADCGSGRELIAKGYPQDVAHAARLNVYTAVPILHGEALVARNG